jgi:hypothetical protein
LAQGHFSVEKVHIPRKTGERDVPSHPLAEVFGFPHDNHSERAERYRNQALCPYNNKVPSCTKNSVINPLGVCSVFEAEQPVITCPTRFREDWRILEDAANFFFPPGTRYTAVPETRLDDADGQSAGNVDFVLVALGPQGEIADFGALEVQSVYISGNVSGPFNQYMETRPNHVFTWGGSVRPDYLSSSRKRLVPQLIYKGGILREWNKKTAVAIQRPFYESLPPLPVAAREDADIAWLIYELVLDDRMNLYHLTQDEIVYTNSEAVLAHITTAKAGDMRGFLSRIQQKLEREEQRIPPLTLTPFDGLGGKKINNEPIATTQ